MNLGISSSSFEIGTVYRRGDILDTLGGQRYGGISTPKGQPVIMLFTSKKGNDYGYRDEWKEDGFFHYTGEGQAGTMKMDKGNLAILRHAENGKSLMLFEEVSTGYQRFCGYMELVDFYEKMIPERNERDNMRRGFIFKLKSVQLKQNLNLEDLPLEFDKAALESLRDKAIEASSESTEKGIRSSVYRERSRDVAAYVLKRAYGFCEGCGQPAPFLRKDGTPYLEAHHTERVSDDGPDSPSHVMALCPTCHTRVHHSGDGLEYNRLIAAFPTRIEEAIASGRAKFVTAALIMGSRNRVFVAQKDTGMLEGLWEFPGGKIRMGEDPTDCVRREIQEELRIQLSDVRPFISVDHDYGTFMVRLLCFTCKANDIPHITEHRAGRWVDVPDLKSLLLAPADIKVAHELASRGLGGSLGL